MGSVEDEEEEDELLSLTQQRERGRSRTGSGFSAGQVRSMKAGHAAPSPHPCTVPGLQFPWVFSTSCHRTPSIDAACALHLAACKHQM
jgi:hypothetical protein